MKKYYLEKKMLPQKTNPTKNSDQVQSMLCHMPQAALKKKYLKKNNRFNSQNRFNFKINA